MTKTWQVVSSNGVLLVDMDGDVLSVDLYEGGDRGIENIQKFDMAEWEKRYDQKIQPGDSIDILLLGYWYMRLGYLTSTGNQMMEKAYEPAVEDYRKEVEGKIVMG